MGSGKATGYAILQVVPRAGDSLQVAVTAVVPHVTGVLQCKLVVRGERQGYVVLDKEKKRIRENHVVFKILGLLTKYFLCDHSSNNK